MYILCQHIEVEFLKKCPFCGAELPEEAVFCLNCSSPLNEIQTITTNKKKAILNIPFKTVAKVTAIVCAGAIVLTSCFFAIKAIRKPTNSHETPSTSLVPVTEENGEIATNNNGEQIVEVTEIIETTTKKGFLETIIDKVIGEENTESTETTTQQTITTTLTTTSPTTTNSNTTNPTTTNPNTTQHTTATPTQPSATDFEYVDVNGEIKIVKYIGTSSTVTVPSHIDGKHVSFLGENAFANNSNIKKIVFTGTSSGTYKFYLPKNRTVFNNLPNLTSIVFPYETHYRMTDDSKAVGNNTFYTLIVNCPKLSYIDFSDNVNSDYSSSMLTMYSIDGVVFARQNTKMVDDQPVDSKLIYYPPAKTDTSYTIPSRATAIEKFAFSNNPYIKSIHFTATTNSVAWNFLGCSNLSSFTVDSGNSILFAKNGVLYTGSSTVNGVAYKSFFYPPAKTDSSFTFVDNYNLAMDGYSFCGNPYLKTVKFCQGALIYRDLQTGIGKPTALTSILLNSAYTNKVSTDNKAPFTITYY